MKKSFFSKHLFKIERKNNLLSLILFSLIVGTLCFVTIALFPKLKEVMDGFAKDAAGTNFESIFEIKDITDYFTTNMFEIWGLLGAIFAVCLAIKLTSGNFNDNSFEMLYTLNLSRMQVVCTKLMRLVLNITYFTLCVGVFNFVGLTIFTGISNFSVLKFLLYLVIMYLTTLQVGVFCFSLGLISKRKFNLASGVILCIVFYILSTLSLIVPSVSWLGYFSPLTVLTGEQFALGFDGIKLLWIIFLIWSSLSVILLVLGCHKFKNDDLS